MNQINYFFTEIVTAMGQSKQFNAEIEDNLIGFSEVIQEINEAVSNVAVSSQQLTELTEQTQEEKEAAVSV